MKNYKDFIDEIMTVLNHAINLKLKSITIYDYNVLPRSKLPNATEENTFMNNESQTYIEYNDLSRDLSISGNIDYVWLMYYIKEHASEEYTIDVLYKHCSSWIQFMLTYKDIRDIGPAEFLLDALYIYNKQLNEIKIMSIGVDELDTALEYSMNGVYHTVNFLNIPVYFRYNASTCTLIIWNPASIINVVKYIHHKDVKFYYEDKCIGTLNGLRER